MKARSSSTAEIPAAKERSSSAEAKQAPEAPRHVAWGVSPRNADPNPNESPGGAAAALQDARCRRPSGARGFLAPHSWGRRPRHLHAFAPLGQSREEILEFREATP